MGGRWFESASPPVFKKIDCVMIPVTDLDKGVAFYSAERGPAVVELWRDAHSVGLSMPDTDAEIVLHTLELPAKWGVHYLVDSVKEVVTQWPEHLVLFWPSETPIGWVAVLGDPFGNDLCILDLTKGRRESTTEAPTSPGGP